MLEIVLSSVFWALLVIGVGVLTYTISSMLLREECWHVRLCGTAVSGYWMLAAVFYLTSILHLFKAWFVLPLIGLGAFLCLALKITRSNLQKHARHDACMIRRVARILRTSSLRWLFAAALGLVMLRVLRALFAPPMAWDALTYHLLKAGRWVQKGTHALEFAPDSPGYYEFFPELGSVYWAWAMLPVSSDQMLGIAAAVITFSLLLAVFTWGRLAGLNVRDSALVAFVVTCSPPVLVHLASYHVENTQLSLFALGSVFLLRLYQGARSAHMLFALAAFSLLPGIKVTMLSVTALALLLILFLVKRHRIPVRKWLLPILFSVVTLSFALATVWRAWVWKGSPTYPFPLRFGGDLVNAGNAQLVDLMTGRVSGSPPAHLFSWESSLKFLRELFAPTALLNGTQQLNFGPADIAILITAAWGLYYVFRHKLWRALAVFLTCVIVIFVFSLFSEYSAAHRTMWPAMTARLVITGFVAAVFLSVPVVKAGGRWILIFVLAADLLAGIPFGLGWIDLKVLVEVTSLLALIVPAIWVGSRLILRGSITRTHLATAAILIIFLPAVTEPVRSKWRYRYYEELAKGAAYEVHTLSGRNMSEWAIWEFLDDGQPRVIAAMAGWGNVGHNWYRYPLLGSGLESRVIYVPATADGSIVDSREQGANTSRFSLNAWIRRLLENEVGVIVAMGPPGIEQNWMTSHPGIFELVKHSSNKQSAAFRLNAAEAHVWLAKNPDS